MTTLSSKVPLARPASVRPTTATWPSTLVAALSSQTHPRPSRVVMRTSRCRMRPPEPRIVFTYSLRSNDYGYPLFCLPALRAWSPLQHLLILLFQNELLALLPVPHILSRAPSGCIVGVAFSFLVPKKLSSLWSYSRGGGRSCFNRSIYQLWAGSFRSNLMVPDDTSCSTRDSILILILSRFT